MPMEKSVTFTAACANEIIPRMDISLVFSRYISKLGIYIKNTRITA
jgi:hypothetical protein